MANQSTSKQSFSTRLKSSTVDYIRKGASKENITLGEFVEKHLRPSELDSVSPEVEKAVDPAIESLTSNQKDLSEQIIHLKTAIEEHKNYIKSEFSEVQKLLKSDDKPIKPTKISEDNCFIGPVPPTLENQILTRIENHVISLSNNKFQSSVSSDNTHIKDLEQNIEDKIQKIAEKTEYLEKYTVDTFSKQEELIQFSKNQFILVRNLILFSFSIILLITIGCFIYFYTNFSHLIQ